MRTATKMQRPAYVIFDNKVLDALVEKKPNDMVDLLSIRGLGNHKVEAYGSQILNIVRQYGGMQNRSKKKKVGVSSDHAYALSISCHLLRCQASCITSIAHLCDGFWLNMRSLTLSGKKI